jgi:hypothetical protein
MNTRFVPAIQQPCPMSWDSMQGDAKRRFCEHCQLHVHNLSEMTTQERVTLMKSPGERKCITYTAPTNAKPVDAGTWLTLQTATGWRRPIAALLAAAFSMFAAGCQTQRNTGEPMLPTTTNPKSVLGKLAAPAVTSSPAEKPPVFGDPKNPIAGGIVCPPTPWWKKMLFMK